MKSCQENQAAHNAINHAVRQLSDSVTGLAAMRAILAWLDDTGCALDGNNQQHILDLLEYAWGGYPGFVRDAMREIIGEH